jgi:hypothetical protein
MPMLFSPTIGAAIKAGHRRAVGRRRTELCGRPDSGPTIDGSSAPTSTVATDVMHAIAKDRMIDAVLHDDEPPATVGGKTLVDDVIALAMTVKVIRRYFVNRSATRRGDCLVEDGSGPHKAALPVRHGRDRPCCPSCCVARRRPRADSSVAAGASIVGPSRDDSSMVSSPREHRLCRVPWPPRRRRRLHGRRRPGFGGYKSLASEESRLQCRAMTSNRFRANGGRCRKCIEKIRSSHTDWPAAQHWLHSARLPLRGRSFEQQYFGGSL